MNILDQVGKEIIMAIKTPKGEMVLFGPHKHMDDKCEAIKRFMEEHKDD